MHAHNRRACSCAAWGAQLEGTFDNMNEGTFKELRRMLPVTRAKFPWEQARPPAAPGSPLLLGPALFRAQLGLVSAAGALFWASTSAD